MSISYGIKTFFYGSIKLHVHHLNLVNVSNIEYSFYNRDQKCLVLVYMRSIGLLWAPVMRMCVCLFHPSVRLKPLKRHHL